MEYPFKIRLIQNIIKTMAYLLKLGGKSPLLVKDEQISDLRRNKFTL